MLPADWGNGWPHVWLGCTVVNQTEADRDIPKLLATPAAIRFISAEPLLGPIDLSHWMGVQHSRDNNMADPETRDAINKMILLAREQFRAEHGNHGLSWVITGGESGKHARPAHPDWFRSLRDQCVAAGVAYHHKQNGAWLHESQDTNNDWDWGDADERGILHFWEDGTTSMRLKGSSSGHLLDGKAWQQFPGVM
jgi:protein gp37